MAVGAYEQIEQDRRRAFKLMRSLYDPAERAVNEQLYTELCARRERYLRALLAQLPFHWHVEHAYTPHETATYGGADHVIVDEDVRIGRLFRSPGDALSRPRVKFWGLSAVEEGRLPSSLADIKMAERVIARVPSGKKTAAQLNREIVEALEVHGTQR